MNIAYIPAREGSKRLPNKNFMPFTLDKSITELALDFANKLNYVDLTVLDTDSQAFLDYANDEHLAGFCFNRPSSLSGDNVSSADCLIHCLEQLEIQRNISVSTITLLQPTSPVRSLRTAELMYQCFKDNFHSLLASVTEVPLPTKDIYAVNKSNTLSTIAPFHDLRRLVFLNGSIFILTKDRLLNERDPFIPDSLDQTFMMPIEQFIDIDTSSQFSLAKMLYNPTD